MNGKNHFVIEFLLKMNVILTYKYSFFCVYFCILVILIRKKIFSLILENKIISWSFNSFVLYNHFSNILTLLIFTKLLMSTKLFSYYSLICLGGRGVKGKKKHLLFILLLIVNTWAIKGNSPYSGLDPYQSTKKLNWIISILN